MKKLFVGLMIVCFVQFLNIAWAADGDPVLEGKAVTGNITTSGAIGGATVEVGNTTDTTISRTGAGDIAVEGNGVYRAGGTDVPMSDGGTGASTKTAAFDALSPMTTIGDLIYGGASGTGTRLASGTANYLLQANGAAAPTWTGQPTLDDLYFTTGGIIKNTSTTTAEAINLQAYDNDDTTWRNTLSIVNGDQTLVQTGSESILDVVKGQIRFPTTAVPIVSDRILDDYREGTWTPIYDATGTDITSVSYNIQIGRYTKIGNLVTVFCSLRTSAVTLGAPTGYLTVAGLPFTILALSGYQPAGAVYAKDFAGEEPRIVIANQNTKIVYLEYRSAVDGNDTESVPADLDTGVSDNFLSFTLSYITSE